MLELIDVRDRLAPVHLSRPQPVSVGADVEASVRAIVDDVRMRGDAALIEYTERFDRARLTPGQLTVDRVTIQKARSLVRPELIDALEVLAERLATTCRRQMPTSWIERSVDEFVGELIRPVRRAGLYVPGGRAAYPSSVVMAAVPAQVAGVESIALCSPPSPSGEIPEVVLAACAVVGIEEVYSIGGAQAIAALAYGTESVRPVDKIVGPGNVYVSHALRVVQQWVGVGSEAGPTEIMIVADDSASPNVLAADLVAQAEHGPHGSHVLVSWKAEMLESVISLLEFEVARHERAEDVENALTEGGSAVLVRDLQQALDTVNAFAPEHLQLVFAGAEKSLDHIRNAGSVFVGESSPVPVGDYVGGTNHVLPTGGSARWSSGLGSHDFLKRVYVSGFEQTSLERLAPHVNALAQAEGLPAHARSVTARLARRRA
ncbi:MAG: histidinol dehydrogenase [Actinomycetota bacterium]|nr:histidinol dehydrogenase [Actinomycetota bacterium]